MPNSLNRENFNMDDLNRMYEEAMAWDPMQPEMGQPKEMGAIERLMEEAKGTK